MANYLQGPAYNTYQVDPYRLPAQQIVQAINTRNQYWDQGASQLKTAYQNYLNLDLSLKANQDKLDSLMQGVNTNLKKVVSTDLSLADNVNTAMKIFDPITKDDDIKYDNAVTKHYKQQANLAQNLKTTNGGKDYNDANFSYMLKPLQDFIKSNDPKMAREVYGNRRYYTPYHDVMAEWNTIEKNFKPDVTQFTRPETDANGKVTNSGRMIEEKNKSVYASQFRAYMSSHLSDKAKEQLRINGVVAYGDHIDNIAQDYLNYNSEKIDSYNTEIDILKGKKTAAIKSGQTRQAEAYQHDIDRYDTEVKRLGVTNTKLKIKDYTDLIKDKDAIAGQLYTSDFIDNISKSSERKDIELKYSKDDVALFYLKQDNDNKNKNLDREMDWKIAELNNDTKLKVAEMSASKKKDKNGNDIIETEPTYGISTEDDNENFGKPQVDKMISDGEKIKADAADGLNKYLSTIGIIDPKKPKATNDAAIEEWKKNNPNDYHWKDYREQLDLGDSNIAAGKAIRDYVDSEVKRTNPNLFNRTAIKDIKPVTINGVTITAQDMQDDLESKPSKIHVIKGSAGVNSVSPTTGAPVSSGYIPDRLFINGKEVPSTYGQVGNDIIRVYDNVQSKNYENTQGIVKASNKLYDQAITKLQGLERFVESPKDNSTLKSVQNVVYGKLAATGIKPDDVTITHRDKSGGIYFKVDATGDKVSPSKIKEIIESSGGKYKKQFEGGSYYLPNSEVGAFIRPKTFSDPRLNAIQTQVDWRVATTKPNDIFNSTSIKFNNRDFQFRITNKGGVPMYEVIDEDSGASFINFATHQPFSTLEEASAMASALANLKPEDLELKIKILGNKPDYKIK